MKKQIVTIIKTRDNEVFELKMPITAYMAERDKRIALWKKTIFLKDFDYDLTITNVLSSRQRIYHIELPVPKKPKTLLEMGSTEQKELQQDNPDLFYKMQNEEEKTRKKTQAIIKEQMENWKDRRAKKFIERRDIDFKKLAATEKTFGLQTTEQKLREWAEFKKQETILKFKNIKKCEKK